VQNVEISFVWEIRFSGIHAPNLLAERAKVAKKIETIAGRRSARPTTSSGTQHRWTPRGTSASLAEFGDIMRQQAKPPAFR
jgi:hypothetical protein